MAATTDPGGDCYSCRQEALGEATPPRERILMTPGWRVAHCTGCALEGWLVVLPRRHLATIAELTAEEAAELGPLLHGTSRALTGVLRCEKTYVMQFSEAEGFHHLHFHVVPRPIDMPAEHRGPNVFGYLRRPEEDWVDPARQDELGELIARAMADG
jgi:diadenosine tetraphosphate (Ap4A) HIT family hydrolase